MSKVFIIGLWLVGVATVQAEVISACQFRLPVGGDVGMQAEPGAATHANVTVVGLSRGLGVDGSSSVRGWAALWKDGQGVERSADLASAIVNQSYIELTVRAKPGYALDLNGGSLTIAFEYSQGHYGDKPDSSALMFSATGFSPKDYSIPGGDVNFRTVCFAFDNKKLSHLTGSQAIRLYFWNSSGQGLEATGLKVSVEAQIAGLNVGENFLLEGKVVPASGIAFVTEPPVVKPVVAPAQKPVVAPVAKPVGGSVATSSPRSKLLEILLGIAGTCALIIFFVKRND